MKKLLVFFIIFVGLCSACVSNEARKQVKPKAVVASYNSLARTAAEEILQVGGNAFDAFVAATLVEYVVAPGVTSLAGPLTALTYHRGRKEVLYLDAEMNHVQAHNGMWEDNEPVGKGVMVPGALRGLESIHQKYGKLTWPQLLKPAIKIAERGFRIGSSYAAIVAFNEQLLRSSSYGIKTFFKNDSPIKSGMLLKQPKLASLLRRISLNGADEFYSGEWANSFLSTVHKNGGKMQQVDLDNYKAEWRQPLKVNYRGLQVYGSSGRSFGGVWSLLALKVIENFPIGTFPHYSKFPDSLEAIVRTSHEVWNESWLYEPEVLDNSDKVSKYLNSKYPQTVWDRVRKKLPRPIPQRKGNHSFHVVIVDHYGNAITGTNTINSLPWGDGIFVEGVPLTNKVSQQGTATKSGERRITPMSSHIVLDKGQLRFVSGTFNSSLIEAGLQFLINVIDYRFSAEKAAHTPRFGTYAFDKVTGKGNVKNWLDPSISRTVVNELKLRGLKFQQSGYIDTGNGAIVVIQPDGTVEAGLPPLDGFDNSPTYVW